MAKVELFKVKDGILEAVASSFGKTINQLNQDVEILKKWLETQKHLPEMMDEKRIQNFLILNKLNLEKTKQKLEMYYTLPPQMACFFQRRNPKLSAMKEVLDIMYLVPLPVLTGDMYRVMIVKGIDRKRCEELNPYRAVSQIYNIQEIRMVEDVVFGDVFIFDCADIPFKYLLKVTPKLLYNAYCVYERIYSLRLKAVYVLNSSPIVKVILEVVKTLLKPKLFERIHFCSDETSLLNHISKQILPTDLGGDGQSLDELQDMVKAKLVEYQERFDQLDEMRFGEAV